MSSHNPARETPGSGSRLPQAPTEPSLSEDVLAGPIASTDDTPTIISRHTPVPGVTPAAPHAEEPPAGVRGRQLAHFELIEPIGVGGMAAVLRARDTQLDRFVALKILPPEMAADPENIRRFHQEARSAAKLDHENIARVFYCGEDQRLHFIAFEFVEGENLRHILERRTRLPAAEAIHYMLQVAAGLAHAAQRGVVHRDIKPSNIIVTPNGRAKLVDMGLARSLEPRSDNDLTQSGVTLGTFDYISPEQALEPRDADVRSDIYSLGCTFYHVLTGKAPVPDGTAAKKLHHHQHVRPIDPRELVPDLPDEVVQILDRMMAKNPNERFHSPEELVHRLLLLARKLGTATEVPEGVLTVETTVPRPPSSRPLLWAGLAVAAVVALVLVLDGGPTGPPHRPMLPSTDQQTDEPGNGNRAGPSATRGGTETAEARPQEVPPADARYDAPADFTIEDLLRWLERNATARNLDLVLHGEINLSRLQKMGGLLVKAAGKVTIRPREAGEQVTFRFDYDGNTPPPGGTLVALTLQAGETRVEGVRFLVNAYQAPDIEITSLLLRGGKNEIHRCEFIQAQPSLRRRVASVVAEGRQGRSSLRLSECGFVGYGNVTREEEVDVFSAPEAGGHIAVVRQGPVAITAEDCGFGPHTTAIQVLDKGLREGSPITLRNCSVILASRRSSAIEIGPGATGSLVVEHSLFSRQPGDSEDGAVLLRQLDDTARIEFRGKDNGYHDLDGYWAVRDAWQKAGWRDWRDRLVEAGADDSRIITNNPWSHDSRKQLELLELEDFARAFAQDTRLASLRLLGKPTSGDTIGAARLLGKSWRAERLPALDGKSGALDLPRVLVVEEGARGEGICSSLEEAVRDARPQDTIVLRHNDELPIDPVALNKVARRDLTIRPARRFRPKLTFAVDTTEPEAALFRLHDGRLRLEGLQFHLKPRGGNFKSQSLVALVGTGECLLKGCVITLEKVGETALSLATLGEPARTMKLDMPPARPPEKGPRLVIEDCFIRGEGDLLTVRAHRPFSLEVRESMAALSGSLLNVEAAPETAMTPSSQAMQVVLNQVLTYLEGPLFRVSVSKDPRGLIPLRCEARGCWFLPAGTGKTLVHLEGAESEDKSLRDKFVWKGGRNNYGGYTSMLTQEGGETMVPPMGTDKWKMLEGEDTSTFGVKMKSIPSAMTPCSQIEPDQFELPGSVRESDRTDTEAMVKKVPRPGR